MEFECFVGRGKRVVIITPFFPPNNSPQSIQSYRLAKSLVLYGHDVDIVCGSDGLGSGNNSHGVDQESFDLSLFRVFRSQALPNGRRGGIKGKIYRFFRPADPAYHYPGLLKLCQDLFTSESYDAVISIAEPLASHLVTLRLLSKLKDAQKVVWFSDPPPIRRSMLKLWFRRNLVKGLVQNICFHADLVISVTEEIAQEIRSIGADDKKIWVLPHVYDQDDWSFRDNESYLSSGAIKVLHSGALYWLRRPDKLLSAIENANDLGREVSFKAVLQGAVADEIAAYLSNYNSRSIELVGSAGLRASLERMRASDILCIIDVDLEKNVHLPSKIADYVAARRPILYIGRENSPTCRWLAAVHPAFAQGYTEEEVTLALLQLCDRIQALSHDDFDDVCALFELNGAYLSLNQFIAAR